MKFNILLLLFTSLIVLGCKNATEEKQEEVLPQAEELQEELAPPHTSIEGVDIYPISHASMVLEWDNEVIYADPVGTTKDYQGMKVPDIILITHTHGDHLNVPLLDSLVAPTTQLFVAKTVPQELTSSLMENTKVVENDQKALHEGFEITAIPMYNLREEAKQFHPKGDGNGYVIEKDGIRLYISGDTEDIPEMRNLREIDIAFICMNLPYTMPVENAADATVEFRPRYALPYHYRGKDGFSDVGKFKELVNERAPAIEVVQLDWYHGDK